MVFGVFDGLHAGHRYFLTRASEKCADLIVVVTLPEITSLLKQRPTRHRYEERVRAIRSFNPDLNVVPGDETLGEWRILKKYAPEVVFLGYDQQAIAQELTKMDIPFIFLEAHHPEKHKSSIIRGKQ